MECKMAFKLAVTRNEDQVIVKTFEDNKNPNSKIMDFQEIRSENLQGLIYLNNLKSEDLINQLESETKFYPIRSNEDMSLTVEKFEKLSYEEATKIFEKLHDPWVLQNNITTVEELFRAKTHLNNLWPNDRTGFFEEFWFLLRSQLGASEITIVYNDMIKATKDGEKNRLIKVKVKGTRIPEPQNPDEGDELVYKNYEKEMSHTLEITEYNKEKGQLVMAGTLKKSPILVMAKIYKLTRLQKAIITSLIDGLNNN